MLTRNRKQGSRKAKKLEGPLGRPSMEFKTLDLGIVGSSPTLGIEVTVKILKERKERREEERERNWTAGYIRLGRWVQEAQWGKQQL